ncbi:GntR family transcriptional regulator [Demequina pelophila]|uniref:GntR family transcriptional regulator n=1 Tax=Demequina pelophila TaxID=1638984 RepID=UPI000782ACA3|nr:GntR family transcriptional regulator [Demequina pelophila]
MTPASPIHERLRLELQRRIVSGEWAPGDRVPSEASLREEFGVSRGPVRQALAALRTAGLISGGQGRQAVVLDGAVPQPFDAFLSFTEWTRATGRTPGQRTVELARRPADAIAAGRLDCEPGDPVVQVLRVRTADGVVTMLERATFIWEAGRLLLDQDLDSASIFDTLRGHGLHFVRARHEIDAIGADATDAAHLGVPVGSPLLRERRVSYTPDGRAVEAADDRYLPGLTSFLIENSSHNPVPLTRGAAS